MYLTEEEIRFEKQNLAINEAALFNLQLVRTMMSSTLEIRSLGEAVTESDFSFDDIEAANRSLFSRFFKGSYKDLGGFFPSGRKDEETLREYSYHLHRTLCNIKTKEDKVKALHQIDKEIELCYEIVTRGGTTDRLQITDIFSFIKSMGTSWIIADFVGGVGSGISFLLGVATGSGAILIGGMVFSITIALTIPFITLLYGATKSREARRDRMNNLIHVLKQFREVIVKMKVKG